MTEQRLQLPTQGFVLSLDTASDSDICVAACEVTGEGEHGIYVLDLTANKALAQLEQNTVSTVRFCKDDTCIIYPFQDYIVVKDWRTLETVHEIMVSGVKNIKMSPDRNKVLLTGDGRLLEVWDLVLFKKLWSLGQSQLNLHAEDWTIDSLHVTWYKDFKRIGTQKQFSIKATFLSNTMLVCAGGNAADQIHCIDFKKDTVCQTLTDGPLQARDMIADRSGNYLFVMGNIPYGNLLYDLRASKRILIDLFDGDFGSSQHALIDADSGFVVTGSNGFISANRLDNGEVVRFEQVFNGALSDIQRLRDGEHIIFGAEAGQLCILRFEKSKQG